MIPRHLYMVVTPIFTPEIGARLALARMKLNLTQEQLGMQLGVSQQQIAKLERGKQQTLERPFTYQALSGALGPHIFFVMFGTNAERYSSANIRLTYWQKHNVRPPKAKLNAAKD